jgi:TMEM175 potassium channel family protein
MPEAGMEPRRREHQLARVIGFSDAVFAIAATLLVIDLRPPETDAAGYEAALRATFAQPAPFIAIAIGFLVVGSYWLSHRGIFGLVVDTDALVVWANLVFLFWVAIQPFFTAALAEHDPTVTSVVAYAGCQVCAGVAQLALWAAVIRRRTLLAPSITPRRIRYVTIQLLRAPAAFLVSIPIAIAVGPTAAMASWGLLVLFAVAIHRAFRDLLEPRLAAGVDPATAS